MSVLVREGSVNAGDARPVVSDLDFAVPPPGMMGLHSFTLTPLDEVGYLFAMRSTDQPDVRLFVVPPRAYFPGYAPRLDSTALGALGLDSEPEDTVLLVVVHPGRDDQPPTANLLAPVAVNATTGKAMQVVLDGDEWPLRAPLGAAESAA